MKTRNYPAFSVLLLVIVALPCKSIGQTNTFPSSGGVGIGTTSPGDQLDVYKSQHGVTRIMVGNPDSTTSDYDTQAQVELQIAGSTIGGIKSTARNLDGLSSASLYVTTEGAYPVVFGTNASASPSMAVGASDGGISIGNAYVGTDPGAGNLIVSGSVGIGTASPAFPLQVVGEASILNTSDYTGATGNPLGIGRNTTVGDTYLGIGTNQTNHYGYIQTQNAGVGYYNLLLSPNGGYVGIGTTDPSYPLSVNGTIEAKEVIVQTGWSDYVFHKGFRLAPLSEVEKTVDLEKHLPGMPSAKEVAAHGINLGEMQAKLLAQIEELTLHVIDQEKRIERLEYENSELRKSDAK